ncbi:insulinase family protein [Flavobacterium sp. SE-s28]|uniref:Insulinase family protein n=2 Tax=Flavobacterium silvaticum TaxID=1852020 RepID=A0A972FPI0_9FLAO|nr:insulinase family protein [Flavobacterium silvaticum]
MHAQDRPQPKQGPSPIVNVKKPQTFTLSNGLKVMVVEDHKLPRVSYNLTIDNTPYAEGDKKGVSDLLSAMLGKGSQKIAKDAFDEEIDFLGANINFSANGAYASGLSKYGTRIMELMSDGALNPNFTQDEFDKEKEKMIESLKTQEKSVPAVAGRVQNALAYGKNSPSGEYVTEQTLNNVTLADVKSNYNTYFVPANAYLVVIGDVKYKDIEKQAQKLFGTWKKATAPKVTYTDPTNVQFTQINFVDMPNAVQSEIALLNTTHLEMKDPDFFPTIIANQVLGGDFNSYLNMNLREAHGWTYGARSGISGSRWVTDFTASSQVRNAVTDSAVVEFLKEIKRIRTEPVSAEALNNVKAGYVGRFVMQVAKPQTIARYALNIETEGLPADFYTNYIKSINAVTPADIQRVANKYFLADNMRIVIVGKGSEVLPGLEKLGIPIFYFDKFANPVDKPVAKKAVPANVTAKSVFESYIKAIGGEKALKAVKTTSTTASGTVQGTPLVLNMKKSSAGKFAMTMNVMGMTMMKQVLNEKGGYKEQQGQRADVTGDDLAELKDNAQPFPELTLANKAGVKVDGIESVNGADAYVIKDGKTTLYYDTKSGLKVAEAKTVSEGGQTMTQTMNFSDYKDVKGIKFPHKMTMSVGVDLEFIVSEVKVNEGVTDADFQ